MKTVKDVADSLKISKMTVYNYIKRDDVKKHTFKQDNTTFIDEDGVTLLTDLLSKDKNDENTDSIKTDIQEPVKNESKDFIVIETTDLLREQLENKDRQINELFNQLKEKDKQIETILNQFNEKDNQINTAQRLLENQQKLQATQMITDGKPIEEKISLWKKIFKKKNSQ